MSADVVPLGRKPRVVQIVNASDDGVRPPDARSLAIERCADQIAEALGKLTIHQRIGLERALDELVDEIAWRRREPWE